MSIKQVPVGDLGPGSLFRTTFTKRWGEVIRQVNEETVLVRIGSGIANVAQSPEREVRLGLRVLPVGN